MSEYHLQIAVTEYLQRQYPDAQYRSDLGGVRLSMGVAVKMKRIQKQRAWPDIFIAEPRADYHGLFIELKLNRNEVFTKAGKMRQSGHIKEQADILEGLCQRGYLALFGLGFDHTKQIIDDYLIEANSGNDSRS